MAVCFYPPRPKIPIKGHFFSRNASFLILCSHSMTTKRDVFLITAVYLLVCAWVWPYVRFYADNADSFQYISIAEHIIKGKWQYIFNGYWSPLISWLLAPFLVFFKDGITAFKYLQILIGVFTIRNWLRFLSLTNFEIRIQKALSYAIIPFVISYALLNLTPDLLLVTITLSFLVQLIHWLEKRSDGSELGKYAVLLYLTKSFGIAIFFFLFAIAWKMKGELIPTYVKKKIIQPILIGCGGWIILISISSGHFTISEAARFNMTYEVAPRIGETVKLPVLSGGLLPPANPEALSAWEEPASQIKLTTMNPINDPAYYGEVIKRNLMSIYYGDFKSLFGKIIILSLILFLLFRKRENMIPLWVKLSFICLIGFYLGYSLILVHARYVWICSLLVLPLVIYFFSEIKFVSAKREAVWGITVIVLLLAVKKPLKEILLCGDRDLNTLQLYHTFRSPNETMEIFYRSDKQLHNDIERMRSEIVPGSKFASVIKNKRDRDPYVQGMQIAYEMKGKYYGQANEIDSTFDVYIITDSEMEREFIFDGRESGIRIYK